MRDRTARRELAMLMAVGGELLFIGDGRAKRLCNSGQETQTPSLQLSSRSASPLLSLNWNGIVAFGPR
ncbi:hypothetical protein [Bradyrhizobium acaciae]|uniref:hypothetical protein n=1 Tax=Bradyrhizobium acaciae TaxID=2683706 RepID=UPI001E59E589|nr:hypothetical protein [Bradyrhizobium acaciae]MCC8982204.1 hypothetical protein [Bradyrhizobium acaciae]